MLKKRAEGKVGSRGGGVRIILRWRASSLLDGSHGGVRYYFCPKRREFG